MKLVISTVAFNMAQVLATTSLMMCMTAFAMGSHPQVAQSKPFSAQYRIQGQVVRVDYQDELNFRLVPAAGFHTTVVNGDVYLVNAKPSDSPSSAVATANSTMLNAMLVADRASLAGNSPPVFARAENLRPQQLNKSGEYQTDFQRKGALRSRKLTTVKNPGFAKAQADMRTHLERMDMNVCGSTVRDLVAWWVKELTELNHAVVALEQDIVLVLPPTALSSNVAGWLPNRSAIQDYRIPTARS
jgi:hypothetical protein